MMGDTVFPQKRRTRIMGILNIDPHSFSGDGIENPREAIEKGLELTAAGADILDIGGESSRPFSEPVPGELEQRRVIPVIEHLAKATNLPISVDTYHPETARRAMEAGARIINDISGFRDPEMIRVAADTGAGVVVMHMQGNPGDMQTNPRYENVVEDVTSYLSDRVSALRDAGIRNEAIILDPGIGFGKTVVHNLRLIRHLDRIRALGYPVLVGPSRKSFIGHILDLPVHDRLEGTLAAVVTAICQGADIVRVHNVRETVRAVRVTDAILSEVPER